MKEISFTSVFSSAVSIIDLSDWEVASRPIREELEARLSDTIPVTDADIEMES